MLETLIAVASLALGGVVGWWTHSRVALSEKAVFQATEANLQAQIAEGKTRMDETQKSMENAFKALAADIAQRNSETFLQQANEQFKSLQQSSEKDLDAKKNLINETLLGMNEKLDSIQKRSTELKSSIDTSAKTTAILREDTTKLREILSSSQQRGQWGERMVGDILRMIGFVENVNYTCQRQVESGQRPDFTFILPQEKVLNMDVKFPLAHYENYLAADNEGTREQEKATFLRAVRAHIRTVDGREYINPAEGTLDYVMLFIPNESIYGFINREDAGLMDFALQRHVLLCSPLTLYAVLSLIHQAARNFTMDQRASEVMKEINQFKKQWEKYVAQMDKLGTHIERLSSAYSTLVTTRTKALDRPLNKIENLSQISTDPPKQLEDDDQNHPR